MKRFFSLSILVVSVAMLLTFGLDESLTANDPAIGSANQPIKVLAVKFGTNPQPNNKSSWLEGLEVQIENVSTKPIQYLVMLVELPARTGAGEFVKVPLAYGQASAVNSKSGKVESLQPGGKVNLRASTDACERIKEQLVASGLVPSAKEIRPNLHLAIFEDRTAWMAGRMHYPDPSNSQKWIAAEELARGETPGNEPFGMSFLKVGFNPRPKSQTCYRYVGFHWQGCCGGLFVGDSDFAEDPTGNVHPQIAQACCSQSQGGGCCDYEEVGLGCEP